MDACREVGMAQFKCKLRSNIPQVFPELAKSLDEPLIWVSEEASVQMFSLDESRWD